MSSKREIELRKLLYEKSKLINQTKKEVKKLRLELNNIERSKKWKIKLN